SGYIKKSQVTNKKPSTQSESKVAKSASSEQVSVKADGKYDSSMPSSLKSTQSKISSSSGKSDRIEYIVYVGQSQLGKPYSSKPSIPSSFDCARFTRYCFSEADVKIKSSAYGQGYDSSFTKISSTSNLKRGDVVCFNTNDSDDDLSDHTGIYLGGGYFIHASSGAGRVLVSSLSSGYYSQTFSWGLRILD
ncbi:MAG: C40 family peptidase, partial [Christensenellales bacterium]